MQRNIGRAAHERGAAAVARYNLVGVRYGRPPSATATVLPRTEYAPILEFGMVSGDRT